MPASVLERPCRILALEPYYGGSHRAFLEGWRERSSHEFTIFGLPAYKWKWRMRHAAVTLAAEATEAVSNGQQWDVLFCSDMLNLAEFRGLAPESIASLPSILYFHENQLTYPVQKEDPRDFHFAFSNFVAAVAANNCWFNSQFHLDEFCVALDDLLQRMPDYQPRDAVTAIRQKSCVQPPGVDIRTRKASAEAAGPLSILWSARWEHDKNPKVFFDSLRSLKRQGVAFTVTVVGESFRSVPTEFEAARREFSEHISAWGFLPRHEYVAALHAADVIVSTALHEFFGIAVVEAMMAGAYPLLPNRLSYPELLARDANPENAEFFYSGTATHLSARLAELAGTSRRELARSAQRSQEVVARYAWSRRAPALDEAVSRLLESRK